MAPHTHQRCTANIIDQIIGHRGIIAAVLQEHCQNSNGTRRSVPSSAPSPLPAMSLSLLARRAVRTAVAKPAVGQSHSTATPL